MSLGVLRVTNHPKEPEFVLLRFPPELNRIIGSLGPASQALDLKGYVMEREHMATLANWARYNDVRVLDESTKPGESTHAIECANEVEFTYQGKTITERCAAPHPLNRIPKFCGGCGQPANPVVVVEAQLLSGIECPQCSKVNRGGASFCLNCGTELPDQHLHAQKRREPRPHNANPERLTMDDLPPALAPAVSSAPGVNSR